MIYLRWLLYFPLQILVEIFCRLTTPIVCLFVRKEYRVDRVKILNNLEVGFDREYLIKPFYYWQTFDNAVDEYFWGGFSKYSIFPFIRNCTEEQYKNSWFIRYVYRVLWLQRNSAYGFAQYVFGRNPEDGYFQIKKDIPLFAGYTNSINIGWKSHRGFHRLMYAGRILGLRKK